MRVPRPPLPPRLTRSHHRMRFLSLLLLAIGGLALVAQPIAAARQAAHVDVVQVRGTITPPMARFIEGALTRAASAGAAAVVLELDTPGGLSSAMDDIIGDILASQVPVVVYVSPRGARAASAGVFITYAAHVAAMAPGTRIGSASPVFMGDDGSPTAGDETMTRKVTNDAVSQIKSLADLRGRNADWGEQAVREAVNITEDEAVRLRVVDLLAPDVSSLLSQIDGRSVELASGRVTLATAGAVQRPVAMNWLEELLQLLANPTVAYILLSLGSLGLFLELSNPGAILPGVVGGLFLLLALYSLGTLPVNWAGVLLIAFAFLLFTVDLFVPSFGALTIGGVISFVIGSYLLIGGDAPPGFSVAPPVIWTMTALLVGFFVVIGGSVLQTRFRRPTTGREGLLGTVGTVRQTLAPDGMVYVGGELWQATAAAGDGASVPPGTAITVAGIDGLRLLVRLATPAEIAAAGVATIGDRVEVSQPTTVAATASVEPAPTEP